MRRAAWFLSLPLAAGVHGAELTADFSGPGKVQITLPVAVDDAHLADPPGYFAPGNPIARVIKRITIENTGTVPIDDPAVLINGRPLLPPEDALALLGVPNPRDLPALFAAWMDRVVHATTDLDANRDPSALLTVFGAAYCGDDARALAAISAQHQGEIRFARLNGHSAAEHRCATGWALLDGDQNLFYLDWDNRTLVGAAEIVSDPLLALRTRVYGRQSGWQADAAWQNTSRFEFVDRTREQKTFRLKSGPPIRSWRLLPGEKIAIEFARIPNRALAANDALRANATLRAVICTVEFYPRRKGGEKVTLPFPRETVGEPVYEADAKPSPIVCQAARGQFPTLRSGGNLVESGSPGGLRVSFDFEAVELTPTPAPTVRVDLPRIRIETRAADRVWWQISADPDFKIVAPNLDRVSDHATELTLGPLDESFLSAGQNFVRAKVGQKGVWSDWSEVTQFEVRKPAQPRIVDSASADGDQMRIRWQPGTGEMLVFGSDRMDFLPEVYGDLETVRMEDGAIRETRPNKNLLATIPALDGEAYVPIRACYRLIAKDAGRLSIPSRLLRANVPAKVLQNRHEKADGALVGRDVATEIDLR